MIVPVAVFAQQREEEVGYEEVEDSRYGGREEEDLGRVVSYFGRCVGWWEKAYFDHVREAHGGGLMSVWPGWSRCGEAFDGRGSGCT